MDLLQATNPGPSQAARLSVYGAASFALGAVLLAAAALKGHQLLTDFQPGTTLLTSLFFQTVTVEAELILGLWLLSGLYRRWARGVALAWFVLLAGVSGYLVTEGSTCCGCLGRFAVSPWFTFGFDLIAICLLVLCPLPKKPDHFAVHPYRATAALTAFSFLGVYLLFALPNERVVYAPGDDLGGDGEMVVLEVERWQGKRLPIMDQIDIGSRLSTGRWVLLFYHANCPKCDEVIRTLETRKTDPNLTIGLIEVPTFGGMAEGLRPGLGQGLPHGQLSATKRWVVATPLELHLENGIVVKVAKSP